LTANNLIDARTISLLGHFGPLGTFTNRPGDGVPFKGTGTPGVFLDHIFVSKDIAVIAHAVEPVTFNNLFPSDHMPLFIDFIIKN
jgi:endonuclease/exonuclease/phosphatase family metal-dependent hydrolase